jgi:hypothetical protein
MKGPAADATDALQPWGLLCNPMMKMKMIIIFVLFLVMEHRWNWQGKTEVRGEKPVPVPFCPPQIPHRLNRDRTRASAVGGRRLTAWAMARPYETRDSERNTLLWMENVAVNKTRCYEWNTLLWTEYVVLNGKPCPEHSTLLWTEHVALYAESHGRKPAIRS